MVGGVSSGDGGDGGDGSVRVLSAAAIFDVAFNTWAGGWWAAGRVSGVEWSGVELEAGVG